MRSWNSAGRLGARRDASDGERRTRSNGMTAVFRVEGAFLRAITYAEAAMKM